MKKIIGFLVVLGFAIGIFYIVKYQPQLLKLLDNTQQQLVFYGNVDDRQVNLTFLISERIAEILVDEGDSVKKGDLLASLETIRIENNMQAAQASLKASEQNFLKLKNGPRQEEIDVLKADLAAKLANYNNAETFYNRQTKLLNAKTISTQEFDDSKTKFELTKAELEATRSKLDEALAGYRTEDIAAAEAQTAYQKSQIKIIEQQLADTKLYAPCDGIVRSRLVEPGEIINPQKNVLSIALVSPKWVKIYLPESFLVKFKIGTTAKIYADGLSESIDGKIAFISPVAEFTPKNIETPELRTALVYETKIIVEDPDGILKLGAPVTIKFEE